MELSLISSWNFINSCFEGSSPKINKKATSRKLALFANSSIE